jgi:V8-like Glu-specific endopeptidase
MRRGASALRRTQRTLQSIVRARRDGARPGGAHPVMAAMLHRMPWVLGASLAAYLVTPVTLAAGDSPAPRVVVQTAGLPFAGTPSVGALFTTSGGTTGSHFCTASVVESPAGNLLITAAHCMQGRSLSPAGSVVFAPGYNDGDFPYGTWPVTAVYTDSQWQASQNPDDDIAFLTVGGPRSDIEQVTGAETLMVGQGPQQVQVIGYPGQTSEPISCTAPARAFGASQLVFNCDNFTNGTSGGPFLEGTGTGGDGFVIGVIGGYQQGGDTANVSYSVRFTSALLSLYKTATAGSAG